MSDITVVLLHGAGTGAWVWDDVVRALGVPAVALDVPAGAADPTPERCAAHLADALDRQGVENAVLVAHSLAGVLVPALAARLRSRLRRCVYVAAVVPPPGGAYVDALGPVQRTLLRALFRLRPRGLAPSPAMIRRELCHDLPAERADEVVARYAPAFPRLFLTPAGPAPNLPDCTYVALSEDRSVPPALQAEMIARLFRPRVRSLATGHLPMLADPEALAALLAEEAEAARRGLALAATAA